MTLVPAHFGGVLGTAILGVIAERLDWTWALLPLLGFNAAVYTALVVLLLVKFARTSVAVRGDLAHAGRAPGYFLPILATCVFGTQLANSHLADGLARALWFVAAALWLGASVGLGSAIVLREEKAAFETVLSPVWLLPGAAGHTLASLGSAVLPGGWAARELALVCLFAIVVGAVVNALVTAALVWRLVARPIMPADLSASHWINLGALAIIAVSALRWIPKLSEVGLGLEVRISLGLLAGYGWILAAAWLPFLLLAGFWRHGWHRTPVRFDPQYWPVVFSAGVFSSATLAWSDAGDFPFLRPLAYLTAGLAAVAWAFLLLGAARWLAHRTSPG